MIWSKSDLLRGWLAGLRRPRRVDSFTIETLSLLHIIPDIYLFMSLLPCSSCHHLLLACFLNAAVSGAAIVTINHDNAMATWQVPLLLLLFWPVLSFNCMLCVNQEVPLAVHCLPLEAAGQIMKHIDSYNCQYTISLYLQNNLLQKRNAV